MEHFGFFLGVICLLSASISLIFALVIFTLRHNAGLLKKQSWATPFAATFFVLAEIYLLRFCNVLIQGHASDGGWLLLTRVIDLVVLTSSGMTNYLLLLSGVLLLPAIGRFAFLRRMSDSGRARRAVLLGLCLAGAIQVFDKWDVGPNWLRVALNLPDAVLSTLVLLFMGYVLHESISSCKDRLMARLASASAVAYAALYLLYGLGVITYLVAKGMSGQAAGNASQVADLLTFVFSLLLKFGLFFPGFSLMLMFSAPLEGIERVYENVTSGEEEYLGNDGILKSIREELEVERVSLDIKLPGVREDEIDRYSYPVNTNGRNGQLPQRLRYDEGSPYARVMMNGEPYVRNRGGSPYTFTRKMSELTVPLIFHNSVIASLKAEIGDKPFTETDMSNLKRITTMVSPAVQAYREMVALNKLSRDLARLQIEIKDYDMEHDLGEIAARLQNVIAPSACGIVIEIGFDVYRSCRPQSGPVAELVNRQLDAALKEEDVRDEGESYRWLWKELKIPSGLAGGHMDEQVFGKFVLGIEKNGGRKQHAPIGTNQIFRRALTDLTTNTLLEFMRGYLNQLTDQLGVELSGLKEELPEKWVKVVEEKAQRARLLWAAAKFEDKEGLFGKDSMEPGTVELIDRLEAKWGGEEWRRKKGDDSLCLYSLEQPEGETHHVIRKRLPGSKAVLWLGVARPDFGHELDYVSPWRYFLDHFCDIADSALYRIRVKLERRLQDSYVESLQILTAANIVTGNVKHNLVNTARSLDAPLETLEKALANGNLQCDESLEKIIRSLRPIRDEIEKDLCRFRDALKRDKSLVCSLDDAIAELCDALEGPLFRRRVRIVRPEQKGVIVGVPWHAAIVAIDTVLDNSKDAIVEGRKGRPDEEVEYGLITIKLIDKEDEPVYCDITDSGPGVPPHLQDKLFREPVTGTKSHSHGLGSFLSALTLRSYHGEILLKHPKPATVRLEFPRPPQKFTP